MLAKSMDVVNGSPAARLINQPAPVKLSLLARFKNWIVRVIKFIFTAKNWGERKRLWLLAYVLIRLLILFCREYGLTFGKKSLKKDHVFLTGAGSGIGRLMAFKLGKMGCKMSISDINLVSV